MAQITETSMKLFLDIAKDAVNWNGEPWVGGGYIGNVEFSKEQRGNLTQLKKESLVKVCDYGDGDWFLKFLPAGIALAKEYGIEIG